LLSGSNKDVAFSGTEISGGDLIILSSSFSVDGDFAGGSGSSADIWITRFHNCDSNPVTMASPVNKLIEANTYRFSVYPNPFSKASTISFSPEQSVHVSLKVYDLTGKLVAILLNEQMQAGEHEIKWNANNSSGRTVSSGVYLLRIESGDFKETRKIFVAK
jgi:hypothetical protein